MSGGGTCRASTGVSQKISLNIQRKINQMERDLVGDIGGKFLYACLIPDGATEPIWRTKTLTGDLADSMSILAGMQSAADLLAESVGATKAPATVLKGDQHVLISFVLNELVLAALAECPPQAIPRIEPLSLIERAQRHVDELRIMLENIM